ncbi:MAG: energy transducer TonB [Planctomycetota bacterium]
MITSRPANRSPHSRVVNASVVTAVVLHVVAFGVWPEYVPHVYRLREEVLPVIVQVPEFPIPPAPKDVPRPEIPVAGDAEDQIDDAATIPPTDIDDVYHLPPPPPPPVDPDEVFIIFDRMPVAIWIEAPVYPEMAHRAQLEGSVKVWVKIDKRGRVVEAGIVTSSAEIFEQAAIDAAFKSRFNPAYQREVPVSCRIVIPFRFTLRR